jgi:hypothetical protein
MRRRRSCWWPTVLLVASLLSACGSAPVGTSTAPGVTLPDDMATSVPTTASAPTTTRPEAPTGGSGGPCGGVSRSTAESAVDAAVNLQPGPGGDQGAFGGLPSTPPPTEPDTCYARAIGPDYPGGGSNYGCSWVLGTFNSAADARDAFVFFTSSSSGLVRIPLPLGEDRLIAASTTIGYAVVLKADRLLELACDANNSYPDRPKGTLRQDAFVSLVQEAVSRL